MAPLIIYTGLVVLVSFLAATIVAFFLFKKITKKDSARKQVRRAGHAIEILASQRCTGGSDGKSCRELQPEDHANWCYSCLAKDSLERIIEPKSSLEDDGLSAFIDETKKNDGIVLCVIDGRPL